MSDDKPPVPAEKAVESEPKPQAPLEPPPGSPWHMGNRRIDKDNYRRSTRDDDF